MWVRVIFALDNADSEDGKFWTSTLREEGPLQPATFCQIAKPCSVGLRSALVGCSQHCVTRRRLDQPIINQRNAFNLSFSLYRFTLIYHSIIRRPLTKTYNIYKSIDHINEPIASTFHTSRPITSANHINDEHMQIFALHSRLAL